MKVSTIMNNVNNFYFLYIICIKNFIFALKIMYQKNILANITKIGINNPKNKKNDI